LTRGGSSAGIVWNFQVRSGGGEGEVQKEGGGANGGKDGAKTGVTGKEAGVKRANGFNDKGDQGLRGNDPC